VLLKYSLWHTHTRTHTHAHTHTHKHTHTHTHTADMRHASGTAACISYLILVQHSEFLKHFMKLSTPNGIHVPPSLHNPAGLWLTRAMAMAN